MEMNHMAKLQPISNITFSQNLLQPWGKTWLDTVSSTVGKAKNRQKLLLYLIGKYTSGRYYLKHWYGQI